MNTSENRYRTVVGSVVTRRKLHVVRFGQPQQYNLKAFLLIMILSDTHVYIFLFKLRLFDCLLHG
jgi:hypothetical protein